MRTQWLIKPQIASVGSCCFVGITNEGVLYIANTSDSCDVPGMVERASKTLRRFRCHPDIMRAAIRDELRQVSVIIGHTYLKISEFNREPLRAWLCIRRPFHKPIPCPEPFIEEHRPCAEYQFVIFESERHFSLIPTNPLSRGTRVVKL
ncbi:hypothetical protein ZWY2020_046284 [Hordeum vulgare]|nr:hypothetical protein ZWY2020_046284 [Hordeum vulgare]